jgi:RNA polymerase sigma-70 factor, ECF subfamily
MFLRGNLPSEPRLSYEQVLQAHAGLIMRVVRTYARSSEDQQDLLQEIRLQVWRSYPKYDPSQSLSTWLYRVSLNVSISWLRKRPQVQFATDPDEIERQYGVSVPEPEVTMLYQLIDSLEAVDRTLLLLYLEGLTASETAEIVGTTATNVSTKLSRLTTKLRNQLQTENNPCN